MKFVICDGRYVYLEIKAVVIVVKDLELPFVFFVVE